MKSPDFDQKFPSDFNFLIRKLGECPQKRADNNNGYYIVADVWGSCFHRIANKKEKFEIKNFGNSKIRRTYTKVPASAIDDVYHVVVNYKESKSFSIEANDFMRIVGVHDPVSHVSRDYLTQTFLIYCRGELTVNQIKAPLPGLWLIRDGELKRPILFPPFECEFFFPFK